MVLRARLAAFLAAFGVLGLSSAANATTQTFALNGNFASCVAISCGDITVTDNGTGTLTVLIDLADYVSFHHGGQPDVGFDLVGTPNITFGSLPAGWTATDSTGGTLTQDDGAGKVDYYLECTPISGSVCSAAGATLTFTITKSGGLTLADLVGPGGNLDPYFFAVDVSVQRPGMTAALTGVAGATASQVPLPPALSLLGAALFGSGVWSRWRRRRQMAAA